MKRASPLSDKLLNAFVDGELDEAERSSVLNRMASEPDLHARISEKRLLKAMVRNAFPLPATPAAVRDVQPPAGHTTARHRFAALAACLILLFGVAAGWLMRGERDNAQSATHAASPPQAAGTNEARVIVHLASSDPARLLAALDKAEALSVKRDADGHPAQVELLVNGGGLSLLRADTSPYAERVKALHAAHANISFVACNQAIENLRKSGEQVRLLPETEIAPSALDEIVLRLRQGWNYVRV